MNRYYRLTPDRRAFQVFEPVHGMPRVIAEILIDHGEHVPDDAARAERTALELMLVPDLLRLLREYLGHDAAGNALEARLTLTDLRRLVETAPEPAVAS